MYSFDDFRVGPWALRGPGPLGGPAHQGRGGPLGAQHTKVEVRVAHLEGMHSFDDFRVGPCALKGGPGPSGGPSTPGEGWALRGPAHQSISLRFHTGELHSPVILGLGP